MGRRRLKIYPTGATDEFFHAELTSTEIYTQVSIRKLQEIHAATHPGARLGRVRNPAEEGTTNEVPEPEDPRQALLDALEAESVEEED